MTVPTSRLLGGKTYMWDGRLYASREEAAEARAHYESDGFETCAGENEGGYLVYTRRPVQQIAEEESH